MGSRKKRKLNNRRRFDERRDRKALDAVPVEVNEAEGKKVSLSAAVNASGGLMREKRGG